MSGARVAKNGVWERTVGPDAEMWEAWDARGVHPAMSGRDLAFVLNATPRYPEGPEPGCRNLGGAGRPRLLDGEKGALIEGKPLRRAAIGAGRPQAQRMC